MLIPLLLSLTITATTVGAPRVATVGECPNAGAPGTLQTWTAEGSGTATATMTGPFDTLLAVRDASGAQLACSDDAVPGDSSQGSRVSWPVVAGQTYTLVATGYAGPGAVTFTGPFTLTIDGPVAPFDSCATNPVMFGLSGPICTPARQAVACGCSEAIQWDPVQGATHFEILRTNPDTTTQNIGSTLSHNQLICDEDADGNPVNCTAVVVTFWLPEWDSDPPHARLLYRYQPRSCNAVTCGSWGPSIQYAAAPLACYESKKEVACYPGDPLLVLP